MIQSLLLATLRRALFVVAFGALLVSVSEFWFYEIDEEVDNVLILLAYGLLGYLFLIVVQRFRVRTRASFIVAAGLLGILIEGVMVPVVYSNPPISIVWTSLAWHALITVGIGWVALRHVMAGGNVIKMAAFNIGFGVFLGLWNTYLWNANEDDVTGEVTFTWQPVEPFIDQFLLGYLLFLGGHLVLDRFYPRSVQFARSEHWGLWALALAGSVLVAVGVGLIVLYPIFLVMVALCLASLRRESRAARDENETFVDRLHATPLPLWRFLFTALIPATAIPTYAALASAQVPLEMNVIVILTAGPLSTCLFLGSIVAICKPRRLDPAFKG